MISDQECSIRVVIRVRPLLEVDGPQASSTLLATDPEQPGGIRLRSPSDQRTDKQYAFDSVLGPSSTQDDMCASVRVDQLASSVLDGYHATVLAYGQTGSGKTHTMEGYRYKLTTTAAAKQQTNSSAPTDAIASYRQQATATAADRPSLAAPAPRAGRPVAPPLADFDGTPPERLGLMPRAVDTLFNAVQKRSAQGGMEAGGAQARHFSIKVSYVQLYKEQVFDLLNPAGVGFAPVTSQQSRNTPNQGGAWGAARSAPLPGKPLHMRWSKSQEFYLENLFKVECTSAAEVMAAFRQGVRAKVMASHALNASSSRSHALFTVYVDSHPLDSPTEVRSARLTLVDMAGSERSATLAAQEGLTHEESVAINKSLLTLRQVIVALTNNQQKQPTQQQQSTAKHHVPYRDSKLTALLKQSLGGNSLTTFIACVSCNDAAYEETVSTLDYAAMARRVVNQVILNEDPKVKVIRELRQEVAFLRAQLAALQGPQLLPLPHSQSPATASQPAATATAQSPTSQQGVTSGSETQTTSVTSAGAAQQPVASVPGGRPRSGSHTTAATNAPGLGTADREALVRAAEQDMRTLVDKLFNAAALVNQLSTTNKELRSAYLDATTKATTLTSETDTLREENARLRDRLEMIESLAGIRTATNHQHTQAHTQTQSQQSQGGLQGPLSPSQQQGVAEGGDRLSGGARVGQGQGRVEYQVHTAGAAALMELQELREENALLHMRLQAYEAWPADAHTHNTSAWPPTSTAAAGTPGGSRGRAQVLVIDRPSPTRSSGTGTAAAGGLAGDRVSGATGRFSSVPQSPAAHGQGASVKRTGTDTSTRRGLTSHMSLNSPSTAQDSSTRASLRRSQTLTPSPATHTTHTRAAAAAAAASQNPTVLSVSNLRAMLASSSNNTNSSGPATAGKKPPATAGSLSTVDGANDLTVRTHQLLSQSTIAAARVTTTGGLLVNAGGVSGGLHGSTAGTSGSLAMSSPHGYNTSSPSGVLPPSSDAPASPTAALVSSNVASLGTTHAVLGAETGQGEPGVGQLVSSTGDNVVSGGNDPVTDRLSQLMAARAVLARGRLASSGAM